MFFIPHPSPSASGHLREKRTAWRAWRQCAHSTPAILDLYKQRERALVKPTRSKGAKLVLLLCPRDESNASSCSTPKTPAIAFQYVEALNGPCKNKRGREMIIPHGQPPPNQICPSRTEEERSRKYCKSTHCTLFIVTLSFHRQAAGASHPPSSLQTPTAEGGMVQA